MIIWWMHATEALLTCSVPKIYKIKFIYLVFYENNIDDDDDNNNNVYTIVLSSKDSHCQSSFSQCWVIKLSN